MAPARWRAPAAALPAADRRSRRLERAIGEPVAIRGETIRLGQLLKLAGIVDSGGEARALLDAEPALVNGEPESRRGRQLRPGDTVSAAGHELIVTAAP